MINVFLLMNKEVDQVGNIEDTKLYFTNLKKNVVNQDTGSEDNFLLEKNFRKEETMLNFFERLLKISKAFSQKDLESKNELQLSLIFPYQISEKKIYEKNYLIHGHNRENKGFYTFKATNLENLFTIVVNTLKNEIVV